MKKHERPETYRIIFRAGRWATKSEIYYTVFHSSEALEDIYYAFHHGRIHSRKVTIHKIQEYNRFSDEWEDRMDKAFEHAGELEGVSVRRNRIVIRQIKS